MVNNKYTWRIDAIFPLRGSCCPICGNKAIAPDTLICVSHEDPDETATVEVYVHYKCTRGKTDIEILQAVGVIDDK